MLETHKQRYTTEILYRCSSCDFTCDEEEDMLEHCIKHHELKYNDLFNDIKQACLYVLQELDDLQPTIKSINDSDNLVDKNYLLAEYRALCSVLKFDFNVEDSDFFEDILEDEE